MAYTHTELDNFLNTTDDPATRDIIKGMDEEDYSQLRMRAQLRQDTPEGSPARMAQHRLRHLTQSPIPDPVGQSNTPDSNTPPNWDPTDTRGGASRDLAARKESQGMRPDNLMLPSFTEEDFPGEPGKQLAANVPVGLANVALGTGQLLKQFGSGVVGGAAEVVEGLAPEGTLVHTGAEGASVYGAEQMHQAVEDLSHMYESFFNIPVQLAQEGIENVINLMLPQEQELKAKGGDPQASPLAFLGITEPAEFTSYMKHDPVGTTLFMLPWVKAGLSFRAKLKGGKVPAAEQPSVLRKLLEEEGIDLETAKIAEKRLKAFVDETTEGEGILKDPYTEKELNDIVQKIEDHERRHQAAKQPEDPQSYQDHAEVANKFDTSKRMSHEFLVDEVGTASRPDAASSHVMSALIDEVELARPDLSRKDIKGINRAFATAAEQQGHPHPNVAWLIDQISTARARRGQTNTPITTPLGEYPNSRYTRYDNIGTRLESFWREQIARGDLGAEPTLHEQYRAGRRGYDQQTGDIPGTVSTNRMVNRAADVGNPRETAKQKSPAGKRAQLAADKKSLRAVKTGRKKDHAKPVEPELMTEVDVELGAEQSGILRGGLARMLGSSQDGPAVSYLVGSLGEVIRQNVKDGITSPALTSVLRDFPDLYGHFEAHLTSNANAQVIGLHFHDALASHFSESKYKTNSPVVRARQRALAKFINSERAGALKKRNAGELAEYEGYKGIVESGDKLTPEQQKRSDMIKSRLDAGEYGAEIVYPELSQMERAAYLEDPINKGAVEMWKEEVTKFVEDAADDAGVSSFLETDSGIYAKGRQWRNAAEAPKDSPIHIPKVGASKGTGEAAAHVGGGRPSKLKTRAKAARRATGRQLGPEGVVSEDLRVIIHDTLLDRISSANKRNLIDALLAEDLSSTHRVGDTIKVNGRTHKLRSIDIELPEGFREGDQLIRRKNVLVPEQIAYGWDLASENKRGTSLQVYDTWTRLVTASALLVPAEATMHGLAVWAALAMSPKIGMSSKAAKLMANPLTGHPGRMVAALMDMWSLEGESFKQDIRALGPGGLRTSHFEHSLGPRSKARQVVDKVTGKIPAGGKVWGASVGYVKDTVFGYPFGFKRNTGTLRKGVGGMETRARVAMLRMLRAAEPGISDAKARNLINNQLGTYAAKLEPTLTSFAKTFDPFARAGTAMIKTGVKTTAGINTFGKFDPNLMASNVSTIMGTYFVVKALDSLRPAGEGAGKDIKDGVGRNPWDIPGLKPGDIPIWGEDGKRYDIPFRLYANSLYRGINFTGVRGVLDSYFKGERDMRYLTEAWLNSTGNSMLGRIGPPGRQFMAGTMGVSPYMTSPGRFLPVSPPDPAHPIGKRLRDISKVTFPLYGKGQEVFGESTRAHPDSTIGKYMYYAAKTLGVDPQIKPEGYENRAYGSPVRRKRGIVKNAVMSLVYEVGNLPVEERPEFFRNALEDRFDPEQRALVAKMFISIMKRLPERYAEDQAKRVMMEEFKGAPYIP